MICVSDASALTLEFMEARLRKQTPDIEFAADKTGWMIRYGAPRHADENEWGAVFTAPTLREALEEAYYGRYS